MSLTFQRKEKILKFDTKKSKEKVVSCDTVSYQHSAGFFVKLPKKVDSHIPLCCPVCTFVMTHHHDNTSFKKHECCYDCQTMWAEKYRAKWSSGWRPKVSEIKKIKNVMNTMSISLDLINN